MPSVNVVTPTVIEMRPTRNAGPRAVWEDRFGAQCSMQEYKSTTGKFLRIGPDGQRMCIDQAMAAELWPLLKRFAETGTLEGPTLMEVGFEKIIEELKDAAEADGLDLPLEPERL